jgi:hypothetical protein
LKQRWYADGFYNEDRVAQEILAMFGTTEEPRVPSQLELNHKLRSLTDPLREALHEANRERTVWLASCEALIERLDELR